MVVVLIVLVVVLIVLVVIVLTKPLSIILAGGASQQARNGLHSISVLVVDTSHLVLYWQVGPVSRHVMAYVPFLCRWWTPAT